MTMVPVTSVAPVRGSSRTHGGRRGEATTRRFPQKVLESSRRAASRVGIARAASNDGGASWLNLDDDRVDLNYVPTRDVLARAETPAIGEDGEMPWTPDDIDTRGKSVRQWSPIALAFLGDSVFELYVRALFFYPPSKPLDYDLKTKRVARAEAQDFLLRKLMDSGSLTEDEISIVKWGRNAAYGNIPSRLKGKGKGGHGTYRNASALECLIGYLYVADKPRLEQVMAIVTSKEALDAALELK